ncbi:sialidase family protein [Streptomyces mirabilis]|uniref:sialidase family protein n=1 Tax=Streptomyces mirabilis TaxID=68239 RepID=UPI003800B960
MPDPVVPRRAFVAGSVIGAVHMAVGGSAGTVPVSPVVPANVQVTSDRFAAHIEPCLAVNPRCRDNLLAACRVFEGPLIGIAAYASFDGGGTWSCTGLLPGLVADSDGNASVAFDARGRGFVCGVVADGATRRGDVPLWVTGDGGRSFQPPVIAIAGGGGLTDHPSLAIDHGSASSPPRLYMAARLYGTADDGVVFVRSRDGGRSFEQPRHLDPDAGAQAASPVAAAGADGSVCVAYLVAAASGDLILRAVSSTDRGRSFGAPIALARIGSMAPGLGTVTAKSGPAIVAVPRGGGVVAAVTGWDGATGTSQILLCASADHGRSWSAPLAVATSQQTVYLQPQLAVDELGRIAVSVYALSIARARIDVMLYLSEPGRPAFGPPRRVTTQSFDPTQAVNTGRTRWLGNYQGVATSGTAIHPIWTDTRTGDTQIFTATLR